MRVVITLLATAAYASSAIGPEIMPWPHPDQRNLVEVVAGIANDAGVQAIFRNRGLEVLSLTWEDTGRWKGSSVGPNISDLTIQPVVAAHGSPLLPVIRFPNFSDASADIQIGQVRVPVGNEHAKPLRTIGLHDYLRDFRMYQHAPTGTLTGSLLADRDRSVLVSAQACLLPVAAEGSMRFAPVLFNYQSHLGSPAVLAILVTPEGTSAQVVENNPSLSAGYAWGQRLFHNANGNRAGLLATRFSNRKQRPGRPQGDGKDADGLSCVLVIQVPLVVSDRRMLPAPMLEKAAEADGANCVPSSGAPRGMEQAVVQAGQLEGPWIGLNGCNLVRDQRFPVRVTVQFYQATDTGVVSESDATRISRTIHRIYTEADAVGSLVTEGATGRPTEHDAPPVEQIRPWPQPWYAEPCASYESATGRSWQDGLARIRNRLGADWMPGDERELRNALLLVR